MRSFEIKSIIKLTAHESDIILGNEAFIEKIIEQDTSLAKKLFDRIFHTKKALQKTDASKAEIKRLQEAEKLWLKSAKQIGNIQFIKHLQGLDDELEKELQDVVENEQEVQYNHKGKDSSIREQLKNSAEIINKMQPVAEIDSKSMSKKQVLDFAMEEFKKFGYQIERQNFGKIEIGKKEINDSLNYLNRESEILALLAVPKVLKRGELIDGHNNHKGRNYETVTIAAPVVINGTRGNMAVIVKQGGKNKYKTHRILMPDGSEFVFEIKKDTEPTSAGVKGEKHRQGPAISSMSNDSITDISKNVNSGNKKSQFNLKSKDIRFNRKPYTEKEYNDFGWARANDILNAGQNEDYRSKFAKALNGDKSFRKTKSGEFMIPVSDIYDKTFEGVNNTIVYAKGTIDKPIITRVLQIYEFDETVLDKLRRNIYAAERRGIQPKNRNIFEYYFRTDFGYNGYISRISQKGNGDSVGLDTDGRTSGGEANGTEKQSNVKFNRKEKITDPIVGLSMGEITKYIANYTRQTVHSKKETEIKINNIINDLGKLFTDEKISLKGKSREYVIQMVLKIF